MARPAPARRVDKIQELSQHRVQATRLLYTARERLRTAEAGDLEARGLVPYVQQGITNLETSIAALTRAIEEEHQKAFCQQRASLAAGGGCV